MRLSILQRLGLVSLVGVLPFAACSNKSSGGANVDAGFTGDDASFGDSSLADSSSGDTGSHADTGTPVDATPGDTGPGGDAGPAPVSSGNTGAFGIVTVNGKQKLYLPQNTTGLSDSGNDDVITVVDVGVAGNGTSGAPAMLSIIDLQSTNFATTTGGDATMIVAASTATNDVWFIDPTTDTLKNHINLPTSYGTSGFSGGGGYVTGIATDPVKHIAYLSVWNGFAVVDLATQTITKVIQAPPSENFGFDSVHGLIYAPFYDCTAAVSNGVPPAACTTPQDPGDAGTMLAGLSVIDVNSGSVYTYWDLNAADPTYPVSTSPDAASVDPSTQIVVVSAEGVDENILDFSKAVFDKTTMTVTAPHVVLGSIAFEGVAVEGSSHIAFWEGEGSADVAAALATTAITGDMGVVSATVPAPPGLTAFTNLGDPHGIAVTTSILSGNKPVGFVVDSGLQWVARVDLQAMLALGMPDSAVIAGTAPVVFLDATTHE